LECARPRAQQFPNSHYVQHTFFFVCFVYFVVPTVFLGSATERKLTPMRAGVSLVIFQRGLFRQEWLAPQLHTDLFHLSWKVLTDITGDAPLFLQRSLDLLHCVIHLCWWFPHVLPHLLAQLHEIGLLIIEQFSTSNGTVTGTDNLCAQLFRRLQRFYPCSSVAISRVIEGAVDARVAREEDFFLRQPGEA